MRRQAPWREVMFKGLPTDLERAAMESLDTVLAAKIAAIEPMTPSQPEMNKYLEVSSAPAIHGTVLFSWKRIPLAKMVRYRDGRVVVAELKAG